MPLSFFNISRASSLFCGFDINSPSKSITLSAPSTICSGFFKLTLFAFNSAELKANKVSLKNPEQIVLGADSVIDLEGELISKPQNREEALLILKKLNGKEHHLISSVCISKNGSMIWNFTDKARLKMRNFTKKGLSW